MALNTCELRTLAVLFLLIAVILFAAPSKAVPMDAPPSLPGEEAAEAGAASASTDSPSSTSPPNLSARREYILVPRSSITPLAAHGDSGLEPSPGAAAAAGAAGAKDAPLAGASEAGDLLRRSVSDEELEEKVGHCTAGTIFFSAGGVRDRQPLAGCPSIHCSQNGGYLPIPFGRVLFNAGGGFDLETNTFTAPVPGLYHFDLTAFKASGQEGYIKIESVGLPEDSVEGFGAGGDSLTLSVHADLYLSAGDRVRALYSGKLYYENERNRENAMLAYPDDAWNRFSGRLVAGCTY